VVSGARPGCSLISEDRGALGEPPWHSVIAAPKHTGAAEVSLSRIPRLRNSAAPTVEWALASLDNLEHD
jgi:hypothetical protein